MLSFLSKPPPRSNRALENPLVTDNGVVLTEFLTPKSPHDGFLIKQTISYREVEKLRNQGQKAGVNPPYHWHWHQVEKFLVKKGVMLATVEGKISKVTPADGELTVPNGTYHTFDMDLSAKEDLEILVWAYPEYGATEIFFRNLFSYLDDCKHANMAPSLFQLLLFTHASEQSIAIPALPKLLGKLISRWGLGFIGGKIIGEKLLGYKSSYKEYVDDENIKKNK